MSTAEEVIDRAVCNSEALSGSTTLESAGDTAVIAYDGATDCETSGTVTYTINGAAQGELTGVTCNIGSRARVTWPWFVLLALGLASRRRR